ncbi:MAG: acetoin utilization protein acuB [Flavobacteriaceae bacterium]|jgi:Mg/Co/Ni transporter MgtE|tara:strand:+ start:571 stop:1227 length:657 start_codon:yes stop_codon:yes gene_type:complete
MALNQFIINDLNPASPETLVEELQTVFKQLTYSHVPVLKEQVYLGCLSETDVYCFEPQQAVSEVLYAIEGFFVRDSSMWLDVLEAFAQNNSNIMPVLDAENNYIGYYQLIDIISLFNRMPFLSEPGGIVVIEKGHNDFSFSQISQIVESNNAKLLGAFISKTENDLSQITLKIGNIGLSTILQEFRRFGYTIISGHEDDTFLRTLRERSAYLDTYLNL